MEIGLKEAIILQQKYPDLPIIFLNGITFKARLGKEINIHPQTRFTREHSVLLREAKINSFSIYFTDLLYKGLISTNPMKFRKPFSRGNYIEIDKILLEFKDISGKTKRKRYLISCSEKYVKDGRGRFFPALKFGEPINYKRWQEIKPQINLQQPINFRYSENGIIVFVDLRPGGDDYLQRFYKNSDLVTSLVGRKQTDKVTIAPDFIGSIDVITVDDPKNLLKEYSNGNWKLIIVGDTLSKDYATALAQVKNYDRYVRFIMATNINLSKKEAFLKQVKQAYNKDNWEIS